MGSNECVFYDVILLKKCSHNSDDVYCINLLLVEIAPKQSQVQCLRFIGFAEKMPKLHN